MRTLGIACAALVLAACSSNASHTLAVEGEPDAVARFVEAERARPGEISVSYRAGGQRAEFSLLTEGAQTEMRLRASAANLAAIETRSFVWSVGDVAKGSTTTFSDPGSPQDQGR